MHFEAIVVVVTRGVVEAVVVTLEVVPGAARVVDGVVDRVVDGVVDGVVDAVVVPRLCFFRVVSRQTGLPRFGLFV